MLTLHVSLRYLRRRRSAWLALAAVVMSVAIPLLVLGVMQGFVDTMARQIRATESDLTWESSFAMPKESQRQQSLDSAKEYVQEIAPFVSNAVVMKSSMRKQDQRHFLYAQFEGIDWERDHAIQRFRAEQLHARPVLDLKAPDLQTHERGSGFLTPKWRAHLALQGMASFGFAGPLIPIISERPRTGMIVGRELIYANSSSINLGAEVKLSIPDGSGATVGQIHAEVSDTIATGFIDFDNHTVLCPLAYGQALMDFDKENEINGYRILLEENQDIHSARKELTEILQGAFIQPWDERRSQNTLKTFELNRNIMWLVMVAIQCICVFIIYAVFSTLVNEKRHDIGVLLALGASRTQVFMIFFNAALICGLLGGVLGWGIGWAMLAGLNPLSDATGLVLFPQDIIYTPEAPISWDINIPLITIAVIILVAMLASLLPALRAARTDPIKSIREF